MLLWNKMLQDIKNKNCHKKGKKDVVRVCYINKSESHYCKYQIMSNSKQGTGNK